MIPGFKKHLAINIRNLFLLGFAFLLIIFFLPGKASADRFDLGPFEASQVDLGGGAAFCNWRASTSNSWSDTDNEKLYWFWFGQQLRHDDTAGVSAFVNGNFVVNHTFAPGSCGCGSDGCVGTTPVSWGPLYPDGQSGPHTVFLSGEGLNKNETSPVGAGFGIDIYAMWAACNSGQRVINGDCTNISGIISATPPTCTAPCDVTANWDTNGLSSSQTYINGGPWIGAGTGSQSETYSGLTAGTYDFCVRANDGYGTLWPLSGYLDCAPVIVSTTPPVSCSPDPASTTVNTDVTLNASGGTGSYSWDASLNVDATPQSGSGSSFTVRYSSSGTKTVTVTSGSLDTCTVTVNPPPNSPPNAYAGLPHSLTVGTAHTHSGAVASDVNVNLSSYSWELVSCPSSCPSLSQASGSISGMGTPVFIPGPEYTPNVAGSYTLRLTVYDTGGLTATDEVTETTAAPTATLQVRVSGTAVWESSITVTSDQNVDYQWSSTNGSSYSSTYRVSPEITWCGNNPTGPWLANTASGQLLNQDILVCQENFSFTMIYTVNGEGGPFSVINILVTGPGGGGGPTLGVALSASPSSGTAPLNNVDLTADVSGTATGDIRYRLDCTNDGSYERDVTNTIDPYTAVDLCNYSSAGLYTAKVRVDREGVFAEATVSISALAAPGTFSIYATPPTNTIMPGGGAIYAVGGSCVPLGPISNPNLRIINPPANTFAGSSNYLECDPPGEYSGSVSILAEGNAVPGTYTLTIQATNSGETRSTTVQLIIAPPPGTFNLTVNSTNPDSGVSINLNIPGSGFLFVGITPFTKNFSSGTKVWIDVPLTVSSGTKFLKDLSGDPCNRLGLRICEVIMDSNKTVAVNYMDAVSLSVTLAADPSSGGSPLNSVLTATISGAVAYANWSDVYYYFWWNCSSSSSNYFIVVGDCGSLPELPVTGSCDLSSPNGAVCRLSPFITTYSLPAHAYSPSGTYAGKVIVQQNIPIVRVAEARAPISVTAVSAPPMPGSAPNPDNSVCGQLTVTWGDVSGETGYHVWRNTTGGVSLAAYTQVGGDRPANSTSYTETTPPLVAGQSYYYIVTSFNTAGDSVVGPGWPVGPTVVNPCEADLSASRKIIYQVNGVAYTGQTIRDGDLLTFRIIIENAGLGTAYDLYVSDTVTDNLEYQSNSALFNGNQVTQRVSGSNIIWPWPARTDLGDKPPGAPNWILSFDAVVNSDSSQAVDFIENKGRIYYDRTENNGNDNQSVPYSTGIVPVRTGQTLVPNIREVAP